MISVRSSRFRVGSSESVHLGVNAFLITAPFEADAGDEDAGRSGVRADVCVYVYTHRDTHTHSAWCSISIAVAVVAVAVAPAMDASQPL